MTSKEVKNKVRRDRDYTLKRLRDDCCYIVPYNLKWLKLFRCNIDTQVVSDPRAAMEYLFSYFSKPESNDCEILAVVFRGNVANQLVRSLLYMAANSVLSQRQVGKPKAAMNVLGCPFYYCSTSAAFLDLKISHQRSAGLKRGFKLGSKIAENFVNTILDNY